MLRPPRSREPGPDDVVLLEDDGRHAGTCDRLAVHTADTPLHLAFSTYLFDDAGRVLLTRRALSKATWPGVWTNSCCGHPRPGEDPVAAASRRIFEELGLTVRDLQVALPDFRYRARDASGVVENELCPVYIGHVGAQDVAPDPAEVAEYEWVSWSDLVDAVAATPRVYSPWAALQVPRLAPLLPLGTPDPPDAAACVADVDRLLATELEELGRMWARHVAGMGVDVLPDDLPGWLAGLLIGAGKRFRVTMAFWAFVACGGRIGGPGYADLVRTAAALETLHLFALVHDDVMDGSVSRRGAPAAHVQAQRWHEQAGGQGDAAAFGRNMAVLLGDLAHTQADVLAGGLPERFRAVWYELCVELMVGQRADLTGAAAGRRDLPHTRHIAKLKSGCYTVERPLQLGALAATASDDQLAVLRCCGESVGRAFALRDDVLGIWGDPTVTGKPTGDDLAEGKATVILSLASELLAGPARDAYRRLGTLALRPDDVEVVRRALVDAGVRDRVERLIVDDIAAALECLDRGGLHEAGVTGLKEAARRVAWRDA